MERTKAQNINGFRFFRFCKVDCNRRFYKMFPGSIVGLVIIWKWRSVSVSRPKLWFVVVYLPSTAVAVETAV